MEKETNIIKSEGNSNPTKKMISILNESLEKLLKLKEKSNEGQIDTFNNKLVEEIGMIIKNTSDSLILLLGENPELLNDDTKNIIREHEFFDMSIGKSDTAMHAFVKPYGYAGDMHLMLKLCEKFNICDTNYELLTNMVFLNFPTAEGVRQRAKSLFETLKLLPDGSKVLNLACGPALEVQGFLEASEKNIEFILIDNDPLTLKYLEEQKLDERVTIIEGNAFKLNSKRLSALCGGEKVELAYSSGLFDYIPDKFAPRITKALFDQVKSGGRLMIGNYLKESETNPHSKRQNFTMSEITDWKLLYRTPEEIEKFLDKLNPEEFTYHIGNEFFGTNPNIPAGTIGFLIVRKK